MNSAKKEGLTIAIDGFSSCGKSTVAKELAKKLKYTYIDSGAMYRCVTLFCLQNKWVVNDVVNEQELKTAIDSIKIHFTYDENNQRYLTWLNGELVEDAIRSIDVSNAVSPVSKLGFVREKMVEQQQAMGKIGGIVMDGRDIGTVVFPDAELKIFMTASVEIRAKRRFDELAAKGDNVSFEAVAANIAKRDEMDQNREIAPLKQADDAVVVDNSNLSREEQFEQILQLVRQRLNS
jgi:cytidylate kinase